MNNTTSTTSTTSTTTSTTSTATSTTSDFMTGEAVGLAFAFIVAFILGLVLGVLGCAGAIKFVERMRGKALFFAPWPRVQPGIQNPTWQNPTYEVEGPRKSQLQQEQSVRPPQPREENHSTSLITVLEKNITPKPNKAEVYEAIDEPINEEEQALEECSPHQTLPYAIHDFSEDKPPSKKPPRSEKPQRTSSEGKSFASGNSGSTKKPRRFKKMKPPIAQQTGQSSPVRLGAMDYDPGGAYSELDKKTSYASLDPHTGLSTGTKDANFMIESYGHLNH